jgi:hypothetical protein
MAKGQQRGNREAKKPKKEKIKAIAAAGGTAAVVVFDHLYFFLSEAKAGCHAAAFRLGATR